MTTTTTAEGTTGSTAAHCLTAGDALLIEDEYDDAIACYTTGISSLPNDDDDRDDDARVRFLLLSHRCSAYLKLSKFTLAYHDGRAAAADGTRMSDRPKLTAALRRKCDEARARGGGGGATTASSAADVSRLHLHEVATTTKDEVSPLVETIVTHPATQAPPPPPKRNQRPTAPKYQYYQSDAVMTISVLEPHLDASRLSVDFSLDKLTVIVTTQEGQPFTLICGTLFDTVVVDKCRIKYGADKTLLKLKKTTPMNWHELFGAGNRDKEETDDTTTTTTPTPATTHDTTSKPTATASPYASSTDWNAVERDLKQAEAQEKPEGEEALNKLFQDIYGKSSDDTRRAMVKSFQTSGGTVLSTNWSDVKDKDYEKDRVAPKGMEWKSWESGDILPTSDDGTGRT